MILINNHTCDMALMLTNDIPLIKQNILIDFSSAKFLLYGVNVVHFSNENNVVNSFICRR